MGAKYRNVGKSVRLSDAGRQRVAPLLPPDKVGEALYSAVASHREAPTHNTIRRILEPDGKQGVNHGTLVQFFYALGLNITDADWEPVAATTGATDESIGYRTLVFTDMEGSSAFWNKAGDAFEPVRKRHEELLRTAARSCQGQLVNFMGDGAFVVFHQAVQALRFAIEAQNAIRTEPWAALCAEVNEIRVRIGMHTGRVIVTPHRDAVAEYSGPPVNLAARIADAAHGGQIVVCDTGRREICAAQGSTIYDFKDCGQHQVKDFDEGIWLWQPLIEGLQRDFDPPIRKPAPIRARSAPQTGHPPRFHTAGDYMVGRDDILETLHGAFQGDEQRAWQQALIGETGIGKRAIADEYERRYGDWYDDVIWLSGTSEETLNQHLCRIARSRELFVADVNNDAHYIEAAQRLIGNVRNAVVVVCDLAFPLKLEKVFPQGIGGRLLVTSADSNWLWPDLGRHITVSPLDSADSARYLRMKSGRDATDEEAENLAGELRGMPAALVQAAVALQLDRGISWTGLTGDIRRRNLDFAHQYKALAALLGVSLFLAEEPIPVVFAQRYCKRRGVNWEQTLGYLDQRALVRWDRTKEEYTVSPWVRVTELKTISEVSRPAFAQTTCEVLESLFPTPKDSTWPTCERMILHALSCARHVDELRLKGKEVGILMYRAYLYLCQRNRYLAAMPIRERVEARLSELHLTENDLERLTMEAFDAPDLTTARRLNNEGLAHYHHARYSEAEPLLKQAVAIYERALPRYHPNVATAVSNLAQLLKATSRLAEAEPLMRRALAIDEASYGANHPNVARDLNNLAQLLKATSRLAEAEPLMRRALAIDEASYGPDHPEVATDLNNLAMLLQATNRLSDAEPLMRRALAINEASYGANHPNVATALSNLAQLLQATNRLSEAEPLMRRALAIRQHAYGPRHPATANGLGNLGRLLLDLGRIEEAEALSRHAVEIWSEGETRDDPRRGKAHLTLGIIEARRGNRSAATEHLSDALRLLSQASGSYAPEIVAAEKELAALA